MDNIIIRPRYQRSNTGGRKRRRNLRNENPFQSKIIRQLLPALIILVAIILLKAANTPVTNIMTDNVKSVLSQNIELETVYTSLEKVLFSLIGRESNGTQPPPKGQADEASGQTADTGVAGVSTGITGSGDSPFALDSSTIAAISGKYSFAVPASGYLSTGYGLKTDPFDKVEKFHRGVDIEGEQGASVIAALDGDVIEASNDPAYGQYVKIQHGDGIVTVYANCSQLLAKAGEKVSKGQEIARVGDTGADVGTHLHFEVWKDGKAVDPLSFVELPLNDDIG